ncbi:FolC bifunctional protein [Phialemonium atrogriseum]|uniref:Folylpolyglutamate synthase n=1 Tax=Phialemonium atrogriseum TaxID=1093897 RepID=A0AAJ0BUK0_9PEZI|nr:FolC bifunctional protein [Phialemonium atrogriseum]KAK1764769.1 FolC bifunctional protein [Phialemonium atrogriseum]
MASSPTTRTYEEALRLLSQLQSNKAVTNLFTPPTSTTTTTKPAVDLNALAIPEMHAWLRRAGYTPADLSALRCVHVSGTKGKGSVSALTASILTRWWQHQQQQQQQHVVVGPVGTYSSPHVASVRERIAVDGRPVDRETFARYFFEVWDRLSEAAVREDGVAAGEAAGPSTKPFYFRFLTILALHVFVREGCRSAVVECGIGAEYDATNVLPEGAVTAAVVTQLGVDHVAMLGGTVEEIAWHKAGVFKRGVRAFTRGAGPGREGVMEVLRGRAAEKGAVLVEVDDAEVEAWGGVADAALQGPFQKYNMALAVAAAREHILRLGGRFDGEFAKDDYPLRSMPPEFEAGLREATLRGRCEVYVDGDGVEWFLDGAHTEDSLAGIGQWFASRAAGPDVRRVLLFNQQDRDPAALLPALLASSKAGIGSARAFEYAVFTRNEEKMPAAGEPSRDLAVQTKACEVMRNFDPETRCVTQAAVEPSMELVRGFAREAKEEGKHCKVLVTGSFHLLGAVIKSIEHVEC